MFYAVKNVNDIQFLLKPKDLQTNGDLNNNYNLNSSNHNNSNSFSSNHQNFTTNKSENKKQQANSISRSSSKHNFLDPTLPPQHPASPSQSKAHNQMEQEKRASWQIFRNIKS